MSDKPFWCVDIYTAVPKKRISYMRVVIHDNKPSIQVVLENPRKEYYTYYETNEEAVEAFRAYLATGLIV